MREGIAYGWRRAIVMVATMGFFIHAPAGAQQVAATDAPVAKNDEVLSRRVTIALDHVSLRAAIKAVASQANVVIGYQGVLLDVVGHRVTIAVERQPLGAVLAQLLSGTNLQVVVAGPDLLVLKPGAASVAVVMTGAIAGRVADAKTKAPIHGAAVTLDSAAKGVVTGEDGRYRMAGVSAGTHRLYVRALGYQRRSVLVTVTDDATATIDVTLDASTNQLDQVVVTGTVAPTERKAVPTAMTVITAKDIETRGITRIDQLFHGDVPGLYAQNQGADGTTPGHVVMASRGSTALAVTNGNYPVFAQSIKTYVDGVELADPSYLGLIDPKSIERIEILTGPQASTIYGSNAINGVMQVFTKRGTSMRPQLVASLASGVIQNSISSSLAPQHDYSAQVSGKDGHISYNAGGSWLYQGPWSPAIHEATASGFGGAQLQQGPLSVDASVRLTLGTNRQEANGWDPVANRVTQGLNSADYPWYATPSMSRSRGQTLGLRVTYEPVAWWSQTATVGTDALDQSSQSLAIEYGAPDDSLLHFQQSLKSRTSLSYTSTLKGSLGGFANAILTVGADGWRSMDTELQSSDVSLTGFFVDPNMYISRQPLRNRGAFLQGQLGLFDALFLTYGVRSEWNPAFGPEANPNVVPRYGIAYTHDIETPWGAITAKVRASYGHATRPPDVNARREYVIIPGSDVYRYYGAGYDQFANPDLRPEQQRGGEGGIELYFGNRGSLIVTRYNQTVDDLILSVPVDSIDLRPTYLVQFGCAPWQCAWMEMENLNVGTIRNDGWETQGTLTIGPFTARGTYSFTRSRIIGLNSQNKGLLSQYKPGGSFILLPEHTYSGQLQYARGGTSVLLEVQGRGAQMFEGMWGTLLAQEVNGARLITNAPRMSLPDMNAWNPGNSTANLNVSQRLSSHVDATLQMVNLANQYAGDTEYNFAVMGRQSKIGLRIRL